MQILRTLFIMSQREATLDLIKKKDQAELELDSLVDELKSMGVGMEDALVTADGFPRDDVDVHAVRSLRVQIIRKQNDIKELYSEIAANLQHAFPASAAAPKVRKPFAVVKTVVSGSIGAEAGLQADDRIVQFGSVRSMSALPSEMQRASGHDLEITLLRGSEEHKIVVHLTPGRSLGAHIVP